jgi:hypothetical protein
MATINLPQQSLDTDNLIGVVRIVMSLLRLEDSNTDGDLDIIDNPTALPLAQSFWAAHADEVGLGDIETPTGQDYATCIFRKLRRTFRDAHVTQAGQTPLDDYRSALTSANSTALSEISSALGGD